MTSDVQRIVEHFATSCRSAASSRRVRDLADDLVLELLAALRTAPLSEIAAVVASLERGRRARAARAAAEPAGASSPRSRRGSEPRTNVDGGKSVEAAEPARAAPKSRDPFDITMPGELLDPTHADLRRDDDLPPSSGRRTRIVRKEPARARAAGAPQGNETAATEGTGKPADVRPPAVSLREGEQLVRSSGAGVVIRRVRSA
ncbi:MAG TPA: hypothetical protein VEK07_20330 [Polyangiaceae bacterium]|nr:hypothetical protein [Polyangiaceae bacterium]